MMIHPTTSPVPLSSITILERRCDELAENLTALGRILTALQARASQSTVPTPEVTDYLSTPDLACWKPIVNPRVKVFSYDGRTFRKPHAENAQKRIAALNAKELLAICRRLEGLEKAADHYTALREWDALHYVPPTTDLLAAPPRVLRVATALDLAEYAARHQNNEAATVPHLTHRCDACQMHATSRHDFAGCAAKMRAEQKIRVESQVKRRKARERRYRAAMVKQGMWVGVYSPEEYDRAITAEREERHAVETEAITKLDRDLSRRGNKYRIQQQGEKHVNGNVSSTNTRSICYDTSTTETRTTGDC